MRQFKTSDKRRSSYVYFDAQGRKIVELKPGENGVTEANISILHDMDDGEHDTERRYEYKLDRNPEAKQKDGTLIPQDHDPRFADNRSNPEAVLMAAFTHAQASETFRQAWSSLLPSQRALIQKKARGLSNVEIAAEEGVSEAAIRNRLKKIQEHFKKLR
jgi:DNA-binding CsgD family transcriptional regulator